MGAELGLLYKSPNVQCGSPIQAWDQKRVPCVTTLGVRYEVCYANVMETEKQTIETVELDQRHSNALTVTLWWVKGTIDTYVTVVDANDGQTAFIAVPEGVAPHQVYNHPFAYQEPK